MKRQPLRLMPVRAARVGERGTAVRPEGDMDMEIIQVFGDKKRYLGLLLLADEQEDMIDRYLDRGEMFLLVEGDGAVAQCVVTDEGDGVCELKSLSVDRQYQRRGYGRKLVNFIFDRYKGVFEAMIVGTGDSPITVPFYESCGFVLTHRLKNLILDSYDHPIWENGVRIFDAVYLRKELRVN